MKSLQANPENIMQSERFECWSQSCVYFVAGRSLGVSSRLHMLEDNILRVLRFDYKLKTSEHLSELSANFEKLKLLVVWWGLVEAFTQTQIARL